MHELRRVYRSSRIRSFRGHEAKSPHCCVQKDAKLVGDCFPPKCFSYLSVDSPPEILLRNPLELARQVAWVYRSARHISFVKCGVAWQKIAYAHLGSAKSTPLDFHFDFTDSYPAVPHNNKPESLAYMVDCCHQIRLLDLCAPLSTFLPIFTLPCSSLPITRKRSMSRSLKLPVTKNKMEVLLRSV
ncbi:hypothetical protein BT96DRAFT_997839 [Gymnopus androsaceus JB14]|uniref:Uncharacterized protein n=1 Tax=Gymnopus androsaceus JB14 TaxID=1447944 RepID=A0A6A4HC55_9AGAR|nr:hypothetical protein BT96DRAFT_997839 [Gymnopus androsaceus JB14]